MSTTAKKAILRAKLEGVIYDIMVKTTADNVYVDDTTTLAVKLAEIIADVGTKATSTSVTEAINGLRQEMLGDVPVEAYNTFTELAQYIEEHKEAADALTEAIGKKADQTTVDGIVETLNGLGALATKSTVSEDDLEASLKEKVNAASEGNHSHANKALLDTYTQTEANLADAVAKKHEHANKELLDGITEEVVAAFEAKANIYYSKTEPETLTEKDLWVQLVD